MLSRLRSRRWRWEWSSRLCSILPLSLFQEFLNDYGMMWVGKSKSAKGKVHEEGVWLPDSSTSQKAIDFDLLVKNIKVS